MCRMWEWASGLGTGLIWDGAGDRAGRDACLVSSSLGDRAGRGRDLGWGVEIQGNWSLRGGRVWGWSC